MRNNSLSEKEQKIVPLGISNKKSNQWWIIGAVGISIVAGVIILVAVVNGRSSEVKNVGQSSEPSSKAEIMGSQGTYGGNGTAPQTQSKGQPPTTGTVTAVSNTSISIKPSDGSEAKTFTVNSSTKVMKSGKSNSFKSSDFWVGQNITIAPSLHNSTVAELVALDSQGLLHDVPQ